MPRLSYARHDERRKRIFRKCGRHWPVAKGGSNDRLHTRFCLQENTCAFFLIHSQAPFLHISSSLIESLSLSLWQLPTDGAAVWKILSLLKTTWFSPVWCALIFVLHAL